MLAPIADPSGCAIGEPVEVTAVGDVAVEPPALLDCATAVAAGGFFVGAMQEVALRRLSEKVTAVRQDSAYVCRTRNGATRLSEHAFGRALDIASFRTASRRVIAVAAEPAGKDGDKAFLEDLRAAACGPFATVLGPGSDPDHAGHFHFDTASRQHGPFCQ